MRARRASPWRGIAAVAAVVVEGDRREYERHRAGSGNGAGDGHLAEVKAERVKVFLGKFNALADAHVGGADEGERPLAPRGEVGEGRAVVEQAVEFFGEQVAASVLRAGEARQIGQGKKLAQHGTLQILSQKFALKTRHGFLAVQGEIGGKHRTAGDTMHEVGFFQHRRSFAVAGDGRGGEDFEHAIAKGGGAAATAGNEEDEQQVVILVVLKKVLQAVAAAVVDVIKGCKRLVLHAAAGGEKTGEEQGGEGFHGGIGRGYGDMLKVLYRAHHRGCLRRLGCGR